MSILTKIVLATRLLCVGITATLFWSLPLVASAQNVDVKGLGRFEGWRDNALIGYGLVTGLSGSGDSRRSGVTRQTLQNVYSRLGVTVDQADISSRNVAVVLVMGTLPASANIGDRISVTVSSAGDARSLAGGTLLMTPLMGPDKKTYALAQGPLIVGGYSFESESNLQQRNYPTTARVEMGATVERPVNAELLKNDGTVSFLLSEPNFTTSERIASAVNRKFGTNRAYAVSADEVNIRYTDDPIRLASFISDIENLTVQPDRLPRIVINERTGTVVAGADVMLSSVVISQGDIRVTVTAENFASQPSFISGFANDVSSLVVTNTDLSVEQGTDDVVASFPNTSVADLVQGLAEAGVDTRRMIGILQAMKQAGALHSEIIIQ
ncbi:flagellar basal body P-ring protein FlgI [Fretibacter rubidus]|uniref:flagellar basal body P-ring protein FlgI n=1 Tax=Fretibacter rubidus TaxID=570162 RepID=UPI00352B1946